MTISVIIPCYNESGTVGRTISEVRSRAREVHEIIVVDGNSSDSTRKEAAGAGADVYTSSTRGRSAQLNFGVQRATGDVLYFLHADTLPPAGYDREIRRILSAGCQAGCFRLSFDDDHPLLSMYAWFTRFDINAFRFGDQSLFILRTAFRETGGYREDHRLMEDNEIVRRIRDKFSFKISDKQVTTSGRKYRQNGVLRLQLIFILIYILYHLGFSQEKLAGIYRRLVR